MPRPSATYWWEVRRTARGRRSESIEATKLPSRRWQGPAAGFSCFLGCVGSGGCGVVVTGALVTVAPLDPVPPDPPPPQPPSRRAASRAQPASVGRAAASTAAVYVV